MDSGYKSVADLIYILNIPGGNLFFLGRSAVWRERQEFSL